MKLIAGLLLVASLFLSSCSGDAFNSSGHAGTPLTGEPFVVQPGSPSPAWQQFTVDSNGGSNIIGIVLGPDRNLWFDDSPNSIGRITTDGQVTLFPTPTSMSYPLSITRGANDTLWFTEDATGNVGEITMSGVITEFQNPVSNSRARAIARGSDGNLWFTEWTPSFPNGVIGRIKPNGHYLPYLVPPSQTASDGMTLGPDGNIWFTQTNPHHVVRVTTAGTFTEYGAGIQPEQIVSGPDGNLWFTDLTGYIGKITTGGGVTLYAVLGSETAPDGITSGPDGNLWFTEELGNAIGRIDTNGNMKIISMPFFQPYEIVKGPDRNLWMTMNGYKVGVYIRLRIDVSPSSISFSGAGQSQTLVVNETNYNGTWTASTSNPSVATVVPGSRSDEFVVTAVGSGSAAIDITDRYHNDFPVPVTVP